MTLVVSSSNVPQGWAVIVGHGTSVPVIGLEIGS